MATDTTNDNASAGRVYKANEVHRRRAERKPSARRLQAAQEQAQEPLEHDVDSVDDGLVADEVSEPDGQELPREDRELSDGMQGDDAPAASEASPGQEPDAPASDGEVDAGAEDAADVEESKAPALDDALDDDGLDWDEPEPPAKKHRLAKRIAFVIALILVLAIVGAMSYFAWNRWGRYDDFADMQGEWYVEGTAALVTIDAKSLHLSEDVVYSYEIDDHEKTIHFSFGSWEGQGRYRFSEDRTKLVLMDGEYDGVGNTADDLVQAVSDLVTSVNGGEITLPEGEGIVVLDRHPDEIALKAKEAAERAAADRQRLQEQEAAEYYDEDEYYYYE